MGQGHGPPYGGPVSYRWGSGVEAKIRLREDKSTSPYWPGCLPPVGGKRVAVVRADRVEQKWEGIGI
ncbi:hypothetical protein TNCV_411611 [Trichonephila clavipes]|nr:hypothetical protein TNCV_411611 [Trichonephila clavipes]